MPRLVARLSEPEPDPEPELAEGEELTRAQQERLAEGPKELYAEMASSPGFGATLAGVAGVSGAVLGAAIGWDWLLLLLLPLAVVGAMLSLVDLRTRLLPAVVVRATLVAAIVYGAIAWPLTGSPDAFVRGLVGMALAWLLFAVLWFVHPRGMGYGDVRLAALTGYVLAYVDWAAYAVGMYSPFLLFGIPGALFALVKWDRKLLSAGYPFGPFLLVGVLVGVCLGGPIVDGLVNR